MGKWQIFPQLLQMRGKLTILLRKIITTVLMLFQGLALAVNPDDVTALMLYNFSRFITLPQSIEQQDFFHLCVVENTPFSKRLETLAGSKQIRMKPIKVVDIDRFDENLLQCQLLYFPSNRDYLEDMLLKRVRGRAVVTVGYSESFIDNGGVLMLFLQRNKLRFHLDMDNAKQQKLKIRAQFGALSRRRP